MVSVGAAKLRLKSKICRGPFLSTTLNTLLENVPVLLQAPCGNKPVDYVLLATLASVLRGGFNAP